MLQQVLFVTGPPGVGKTTIVQHIFEHYRRAGVVVAGIVTREVRSGGVRVGFKIQDLTTGEEGWLARVQGSRGPRVGRYMVESDDLDRIGAKALETGTKGEAKLVLIDEIGPMEMTSQRFREALSELLRSAKPVVATVKQGSRYHEVLEALNSNTGSMLEVTLENRDAMVERIISTVEGMAKTVGE